MGLLLQMLLVLLLVLLLLLLYVFYHAPIYGHLAHPAIPNSDISQQDSAHVALVRPI